MVNWWLLGSSRRTLIGTGQTRCLSTALVLYNKIQKTAKRFNRCTLRYNEERTAGHRAKLRIVHAALLSFTERLSNLRKNYNAYTALLTVSPYRTFILFITIDRTLCNIRLARPSGQVFTNLHVWKGLERWLFSMSSRAFWGVSINLCTLILQKNVP
jgi:hypothetical protein